MKIVLIGYMGSGKSTIGKQLAELLKLPFLDLDTYIEEKEQRHIQEIFKAKGEVYFRKLEHNCLKALLETDTKMVLSVGGGTPCYTNNETLLFENPEIITIYLNVPVIELGNRLFLDKDKRPLIAHIDSMDAMLEFVGKHLFERTIFYQRAKIVIDANKHQKAIIESLLLCLF